MARATSPWTPIGWVVLGAVATYVVASVVRARPQRLRPIVPPVPDLLPEPVSGDDHDDEYVFDPDDPPPSEEEYDDRMPCATNTEVERALLLGEDGAGCLLPAALEPKKGTTVPDAALPTDAPVWPVRANRRRDVRVSYQDVRGKWHGRWGRHFGAGRRKKDGSGGRHHAGVDLHGDVGDVVVAAEPGTVEAILPFTGGTWAVYVRAADGTMINYGEVERGSWKDYGVGVGTELVAGDAIARVGQQSEGGAHMLHLEIYRDTVTVDKIRQRRMQWPLDAAAPADLLDPTRYLLAAQERWLVDHPDIA